MKYKQEELIKKFEKMVSRNQFTTIKPNQRFFDFYAELDNYFATHMMPKCEIELVEDEVRFYIFNDTIKMSENVIKIFDEDICNITLLPHKNGIELYRFEMYQKGKGFGSTFMNALTQISKQLGIDIYMIPGTPGFNNSGDSELRRQFYHKFNFKRMKNSKFWKN